MKKITVLFLLLSVLLSLLVACENGSDNIEIGGDIVFRDEGVQNKGEDDFGGGGTLFPSGGVDLPPVTP